MNEDKVNARLQFNLLTNGEAILRNLWMEFNGQSPDDPTKRVCSTLVPNNSRIRLGQRYQAAILRGSEEPLSIRVIGVTEISSDTATLVRFVEE